jgi:pimeloyl-ACP methyl ester carboxylesterase
MREVRTGSAAARKLLAAVVVLGFIGAACSSSSKTAGPAATTTTAGTAPSTAPPIPAPKGLPAFYSVPQPIPTATGKLIKSEAVKVPGVHGTVYRVMYVSQTVDNKPVPVTGLIAVPNTAPPTGGYPVVTWGHGTNGMADICTPSLTPANDVPLANALLDKGWVVTSSDYQGEGTPGILPYIAGVSAARNTIDIVRAASDFPAAHTSDHYVVWGHSEGGQTAMFASNIGPTYAPELKLEGVVAGAPPSQFALIYAFLLKSPYRYYLLMAAGGLNAAYGDKAPLDQVLTPAGLKLIPELDKGCAGDLSEKMGSLDVASLTKGDPFKVPSWKKVLQQNDPQEFTKASPAPLLIIQGGNDEQIPPVSTQILARHLCSLHQVLQRWIYPGQSHSGVIGPSAADMIRWISDRFAGGKNPDPYAPVGQSDVQVTTCAPGSGPQ